MRRAFGLWLVAWCATACGGAERRVVEPPPRKNDGVAQKIEAAAVAQREVAEAAELDGGPHFGGGPARSVSRSGTRSTRRRGASSTAAAPAALPSGSPFSLTSGGVGWSVVGTYHSRDWTSMVLEAPAGEVGLREHFRAEMEARCRKVEVTSSDTMDAMRCDDDPDGRSKMSVVIERTGSRPMVDLHWR